MISNHVIKMQTFKCRCQGIIDPSALTADVLTDFLFISSLFTHIKEAWGQSISNVLGEFVSYEFRYVEQKINIFLYNLLIYSFYTILQFIIYLWVFTLLRVKCTFLHVTEIFWHEKWCLKVSLTAPQLPIKHFYFRFSCNLMLKTLSIRVLLFFFGCLFFYFIVSQTKPGRKILFSKSPSVFLRLDDSDAGDKFKACTCRLQAAGVTEPRPLYSSALFEDNIIIRSVAFSTAGCSSLIGPS